MAWAGWRSASRGTRGGLVETYLLIALLFPLASLPLAAAGSPVVMAALILLSGSRSRR